MNQTAKKVETPGELEPYLGPDAFPDPVGAWKRHCCNEPLMSEEARLCEATADYLYLHFTPVAVNYCRGSRPVLEGLHRIVLKDGPAPPAKEFAFLIWDWIYENVCRRYGALGPVCFSGFHYFGTEEEEAALRVRSDCYASSRLLAAMLQAGGIPARLIHMHHADLSSMHTAAEAYLDGKWCFLDQNCHDYALNRQGEVAGFWEIVTDDYCRSEGLREDVRKLTPIRDTGRFDCISIQNCPIGESTANYNRAHGSLWWGRDPHGAARACRFGF